MVRLAAISLTLLQVCACNGSATTGKQPEPLQPPPVSSPLAAAGATANGTTTPRSHATASEEIGKAQCSMASTSVRLRVNAGQVLPTGTGLDVLNEGTSHLNFGPGGSELNISLVFHRAGQQQRFSHSFRDRNAHEIFDHCYRIVDSAAGVVLLEVSALPSAAPPTPGEEGEEGAEGEDDEGPGEPPPSTSGKNQPVAPPNVGGGATCTVTDDNGPEPGGEQVTHGCAPNEMCVCEAHAAYSCRGRCAPVRAPKHGSATPPTR